jgi:hypothetical protein
MLNSIKILLNNNPEPFKNNGEDINKPLINNFNEDLDN